MKRRDFFKTPAALATALGLPATALATASPDAGAAMPEDGLPALPLALEVTRLRVGTRDTADLRRANRLAREAGQPQPLPDPPDDENNYWAEAIRWGDRFFYRVGSTMVECSEYDYTMVIANPNTDYFSRALWLHVRIRNKRDGIDDPGAFGRDA